MRRRLAEFLLWVDYRTDGIRLRLFVAAAVVQVFLAPLWDQYLPFERVAARMEPMTLLATLNFLALTFALLGGRLLALSASDDDAESNGSRRSVRQMLGTALSFAMRYFRLMRLEPWPAFISRIGAGLCPVQQHIHRGWLGLVHFLLLVLLFFLPTRSWPRRRAARVLLSPPDWQTTQSTDNAPRTTE